MQLFVHRISNYQFFDAVDNNLFIHLLRFQNMERERIPRFTAAESLKEKTCSYRLNIERPRQDTITPQLITPQFSLRSFICAAAVATCLVQPETCELIAVACDVGQA